MCLFSYLKATKAYESRYSGVINIFQDTRTRLTPVTIEMVFHILFYMERNPK